MHSLGVAEEWPVEGAKTKYILVALVVIVIVTASVGYYLIKDGEVGVDGITAMEGLDIANPLAKNWNTSAVLIVASKGSNMNGNGEFQLWYYLYTNTQNFTNTPQCLEIQVFSNGSYKLRYDAGIGDKRPINSYIIDSDKAYDIATAQSELKTFFIHNPMLDHMSLSNSSGTPSWYIDWAYDAGFDNPKWAEIQIDANTGEVLYVEADN